MDSFKVGAEVQLVTNDGVLDGVVVLVTPPKEPKPKNWYSHSEEKQKDYETHATVRWLDGSEEVVNIYLLDERDDQYQREFRNAANKTLSIIDEKVGEAYKLLQEAVDLSNKNGIPFSSPVSFLGQSYNPHSMKSMYPEVSEQFMHDATGSSGSEYGNRGWQHSDVC